MKYLVCINTDGLQCKFKLGKDPVSTQLKIQSEINKEIIRMLFEIGKDPRNTKEFENKKKEIIKDFSTKDDFWLGYHGYEIRKTTIGKYIEVQIEMDEKDFIDAEQNGLDGVIEILQNVEKLISPSAKDSREAGEIVFKWIKRLQNEKDL